MPKNKITQEYIAEQLNISRNTVSKALNNLPGITQKTRDAVIAKAIELNYRNGLFKKDISEEQTTEAEKKEIAFICHSDSFVGSFWLPIIQHLELVLREKSTNLRLVIVRPDEEQKMELPASLTSPPPDGIIMAGLFKNEYYRKVAKLGYPTVTLDTAPDIVEDRLICDVVLMNNFYTVYNITKHIINQGHTHIVFAGDKLSCLSFYQRWEGYQRAMLDSNLEIPSETQFDFPSDCRHYLTENFYDKLKDIKDKPTAFVCANDNIAKAVDMLKYPPYKLYDTITISGFDNTTEIIINIPDASTVEVFPDDIGRTLGEQILWRINNQNRKYRIIQIDSKPIIK